MSASGGCGCGGSSAVAVKGGCDCGGSCGGGCGCEVSTTGEGFVRPRFFGGMLLTEDDLQAAVDYTVAKRKLTNRHVIGAGVVCGLEVTCHPCDPAKVSVSPGYAIECCGNDILVSCAEEVDVIALVRDLRLRTGVDCGEPCDDNPRKEFYLYVRYAETPTAPVAPYASDDCATGECEFSRIREGYCFELRCDPPGDEPTILDALKACRPSDDESLRDDADKLVRAITLASTYSDAISAKTADSETLLTIPKKEDFDEQAGADVKLSDAVELIRRATRTLALDAAAARGTAPSPRINAPRRALLASRSKELAVRMADSKELEAQPPAERQRVERILRVAAEQPDLSGLNSVDRAMLSADGTTAAEAEREFLISARQVQQRVLRELGGRGQTTCDEYRTVSSLRFDSLTKDSQRDVSRVGEAYLRSIVACVCSAFNPPCPTCTDDAVALAKVTVDGCEVTHVCALERRWVLSPRALGYWFPVVETFRQGLEQMCCEPTRFTATVGPFDPLRYMSSAYDDAEATFRQALSADAPGKPVVQALRLELGMEVAAQPEPVPDPAAGTAAGAGGGTDPAAASEAAAARIGALESQLAELVARLDKLSSADAAKEGENT
jgi:hypothetical protein